MSVRKRTWKSPNGETKEAWVVDYVDQHGERHLKTFASKRDADAHHAIVGTAVRAGTHTADSKSVTVAKAAELWLASCEAAGLERTTLVSYRQHSRPAHRPHSRGAAAVATDGAAGPRLRGSAGGRWALAGDGAPGPDPARRAHCRCAGARPRGSERRALAADFPPRQGRERRAARQTASSRVGVDIPTPDEMRAIIAKLPEIKEAARFRPLLLTAIFTGLRASELRGLRWADVDLKRGELHVRQRADRYGKIGRPKSEAGERTVPLPPMLVSVLREHRLACPNGRAWPRLPEQQGPHRSSQQHRRARLPSGAGRGRCGQRQWRRQV